MRQWGFVVIAFCIALSTRCHAAESNIKPATESLLVLDRDHSWSFGVLYQIDHREFDAEGETVDMDIHHLRARLGCNPLPFLHAYLEAGRVNAERRQNHGEGGLEWTIGASANIIEHPIRMSPMTGYKEVLGLFLDGSVEHGEEDFDGTNMDWYQLKASPRVSYTLNRKGDAIWHAYEPAAVAVHLGLIFLYVDGDIGGVDIGTESNFGMMTGVDFLTAGGWVARVHANVYGSDREISFGALYNF